MLPVVRSTVMCWQLKSAVGGLDENSHGPPASAGTVFSPVVELYLYDAFGVLPKCSNVAQIISGWPFVLPTTWMLTSASWTLRVPLGTHCAAFPVLKAGTVAFIVM